MIDQNLEFFNTAELLPAEDGGKGLELYRCPREVCEQLNPTAQNAAAYTTGSEIRFVPEGDGEVRLTLRSIGQPITRAIVYYGSIQSGWQTLFQYICDRPTELCFRVPNPDRLEAYSEAARQPFSPRVVRLLLPDEGAKIAFLGAQGAFRPPRAEEVPDKCLLFYGSSITHGSLACTPNGFFSSQVGRTLRCDVQNQGYAGGCHMEAAMAEYIAGKGDWTACVAEMGINIVGAVEPEEYRRRVREWIRIVHGANPKKYLFLTDLFYSPGDFRGERRVAEYRKAMADEVEAVRSPYVVYFNGLSLLNGVEYLSADLIHPTLDGVNEIARNLTAKLRPYLA